MNHKSRAIFIIMACLLVATKPDQGLDCRKLIYSRNCRGVAIKRGHIERIDTRSGILLNALGLKEMFNNLNEAIQSQEGGRSRIKKIYEDRIKNELSAEKFHDGKLLYASLLHYKEKNDRNENLPPYKYYNL